jgi:hypothetical protein
MATTTYTVPDNNPPIPSRRAGADRAPTRVRHARCPSAESVSSFRRSAPPSQSPRRPCERSCSAPFRRPVWRTWVGHFVVRIVT